MANSEPKWADNQFATNKNDLVTDDPSAAHAARNTWRDYPKTVFCIISNEFCERFSYYGMRSKYGCCGVAVLVLYMINILSLDDDSATASYHGFIVLCYTTPLLGSILADGYIGKYRTILYVSLLYASGNVIVAVASFFDAGINPHPWLDALGLVVIGIGTGGIKPCVSAFGGDQFVKGQERWLGTYFSVFYFSINAGSTISHFITPYFRTISCAGQDSCYPLAFGVPAILMVTATGVFLLGTPWYRRKPPQENVIGMTFKCIVKSLQNMRRHNVHRNHWLDHYVDDEGDPRQLAIKTRFKEDVKVLLRVCVMYLPVPVFWALFDQQGSRWLIQGVAMDGRVTNSWTLLPDQIITLNSVLILVFIPLFQFVVYPLVRKLGINPTPLRRMSMGGYFAAAAFVIAGFVQLKVNTTLRSPPAAGQSEISFSNTFPCQVNVTQLAYNGQVPPNPVHLVLPPVNFNFNNNTQSNDENPRYKIPSGNHTWSVSGSCLRPSTTQVFSVQLNGGKTYNTPLTNYGFVSYINDINKSQTGKGQSKVSVIGDIFTPDIVYFCAADAQQMCNPTSANTFAPVRTRTATRTDISAGDEAKTFVELLPPYNWHLYMKTTNGTNQTFTQLEGTLFNKVTQGGIYSMVLFIPQYVVITAAEIMFSITGLEFSYSQAPANMKSVIQAVWLLTVAGGDVIVLIIAGFKIFSNLAVELLVYAGLMAFVITAFSVMSIFYYSYIDVDMQHTVHEETLKSESEA